MVAFPTAIAVTLPLASTVATLSSDVAHVTVLSVVVAGFTVAISVSVSVAFRVIAVLFRVMDAAGVASTVTTQVADTLPQVAVMVAFPTAIAVTLPFASTVATLSSDEVHVTVLSVVVTGSIVAVSVSVSVAFRVIAVLFRVMDAAGVASTVTAQVADTLPQVAVIVAFPTAIAVTLPFASTVATLSSDEVHVTVLSVVVAGSIVAVSVSLSVAFRVIAVLLRFTDSAGVADTVT